MEEQEIGALVRRAVEAIWNRGELDRADRLVAADYVNHGGLIPDVVRGPEAIKLCAAFFRAAFPRLRLTVEDLLVGSEVVALRWTARGAPGADGAIDAQPGVGGTVAGMTFARLAGGRIAESWTRWNVEPGPADGAAPGVPRPRGSARPRDP